jgi:hypothetical protein
MASLPTPLSTTVAERVIADEDPARLVAGAGPTGWAGCTTVC